MPYIYQIINKINGKIYIGKTLRTIEDRWKEHCREYKIDRNEKRPLYRAMMKYGVENFEITEIEEVNPESLDKREIYWIELLGSFKNGYNATKGGDGKHYADYDLIYQLFQEGKNNTEIQKITGYDRETITAALDNYGISKEERFRRGRENIEKGIIMIDKDTEKEIKIFPSIQKAYDFLGKSHSGHIASVCNGKRKTAYGYKWRYTK